MLYNENLEEIIFSKHHITPSDELIIISGYIGPAPIQRLEELDINVTIIAGMYPNGINEQLWNNLKKLKENNSKLTILFSTIEIHSKVYMWKYNQKVISALIGSANFSSNGLRSDFREILADATIDTFEPLNKYFEFIKNNSTTNPILKNKNITEDITLTETKTKKYDLRYSCEIPLYSVRQNKVPEKSGLNWGLADGHVAEGDGYIALTKEIIQKNTNLIKPYDQNYQSSSSRTRQSEPVEIIWDDGYIMAASFEGTNKINNKTYPKQITSYSAKTPYLNGKKISKKSILGRYLRKRLNVPISHKITMEDLNKYGRNTITLSLIEDGIYYADFSV